MSAGQLWRKILSPSEAEVAELIAKGMNNKEIATDLCLSEQTIKFHISNCLRKLDMSTRTQLAIWWVRDIEMGYPIPERWEGTD